jgi:16S rRNA (guanine527-N7)-methyltransferase
MSLSLTDQLDFGLLELGLTNDSAVIESLLAYLSLLEQWNSTFNLVADADSGSMVSRHLLDSLAIQPYLTGTRIIDFGTGAGLPGIPLAILNPDKEFILIDSNGKKTRFLFQVKIALNLSNVTIENCRIEHYQSKQQIDMVMCRAFSSLEDIVTKSQQLLSSGSKLLAMKGRYPEQEINRLPDDFEVTSTERLTIPGSDSQRFLIEIKRR